MDYKRIIKVNLRLTDTLYGNDEKPGNCCDLSTVKRVTNNVPDCKKYEVRYRECKSGEFIFTEGFSFPIIKKYDNLSMLYSVCFMKKEDVGKRFNRTVRIIE